MSSPSFTINPDDLPAGLLDWAEKAGIENLKERIESASTIAAQAATTLTVLLAGIGGSLAYAVKVFDSAPGRVAVGAAALCVYLTLLALSLVLSCIRFTQARALYNQPAHLVQPGYSLAALRYVELGNIEQRIAQMAAHNNRRADRLNTVRVLAALAPFVFMLAVWLT